jgi:ABC-type glycerol-3-phosphate transport system substrate-binding protein
LIVSRLPEFTGSREYALVADLRVLIMPAEGAVGKGVEKAIAFLAEPETQRALADALGMVPAALDAPIRDGASYAAVEAVRNAGTLLSPPAVVLGEKRAAAFATALDKALRSPRDLPSILTELYGGQ